MTIFPLPDKIPAPEPEPEPVKTLIRRGFRLRTQLFVLEYMRDFTTTDLKVIFGIDYYIVLHEMQHLIQNYNHNHSKGQYRSVYFEELLSESATLLMGKELYRKPVDSKHAVSNIYYFGCNFASWLYNKSGKSMNIFRDMRDSKASSGIKAIVESANKNGIDGNFSDMVKGWLKEQFNISDSETSEHLLILEGALNKNSMIVGGI